MSRVVEDESAKEMIFALKIILSTVDHLLQNQEIELKGKKPARLKSKKEILNRLFNAAVAFTFKNWKDHMDEIHKLESLPDAIVDTELRERVDELGQSLSNVHTHLAQVATSVERLEMDKQRTDSKLDLILHSLARLTTNGIAIDETQKRQPSTSKKPHNTSRERMKRGMDNVAVPKQKQHANVREKIPHSPLPPALLPDCPSEEQQERERANDSLNELRGIASESESELNGRPAFLGGYQLVKPPLLQMRQRSAPESTYVEDADAHALEEANVLYTPSRSPPSAIRSKLSAFLKKPPPAVDQMTDHQTGNEVDRTQVLTYHSASASLAFLDARQATSVALPSRNHASGVDNYVHDIMGSNIRNVSNASRQNMSLESMEAECISVVDPDLFGGGAMRSRGEVMDMQQGGRLHTISLQQLHSMYKTDT